LGRRLNSLETIGGLSMNVYKSFIEMVRYVSEAAARIFSPSEDAYPATGTVPFEGVPYDNRRHSF